MSRQHTFVEVSNREIYDEIKALRAEMKRLLFLEKVVYGSIATFVTIILTKVWK